MNPFVLPDDSPFYKHPAFKRPGGPVLADAEFPPHQQEPPPFPERQPFPIPPGYFGPSHPIRVREENPRDMESDDHRRAYHLRMFVKFEMLQEAYLEAARFRKGHSDPKWIFQSSRALMRAVQHGHQYLRYVVSPADSGDMHVRMHMMHRLQKFESGLRSLANVQDTFREITALLLFTWNKLEPTGSPPHFSRALERMGLARVGTVVLVDHTWELPTQKRFMAMMRPFLTSQDYERNPSYQCERFFYHLGQWYRLRFKLQEALFDFQKANPHVPLDKFGRFGAMSPLPPSYAVPEDAGIQRFYRTLRWDPPTDFLPEVPRPGTPPPLEDKQAETPPRGDGAVGTVDKEDQIVFYTSDKVPLLRLPTPDPSAPVLRRTKEQWDDHAEDIIRRNQRMLQRDLAATPAYDTLPPVAVPQRLPPTPQVRRRVLSPTPSLFAIFLHILLLFSSVTGGTALFPDALSRDGISSSPPGFNPSPVAPPDFSDSATPPPDASPVSPPNSTWDFARVLEAITANFFVPPRRLEDDPAFWLFPHLDHLSYHDYRDVYLAGGDCHSVETTLRLLGGGPGPIRTFTLSQLREQTQPVRKTKKTKSVMPLKGQVTIPWYQRSSHVNHNLSQAALLTKLEDYYGDNWHHRISPFPNDPLDPELKIELTKEAYDPRLPMYLSGRTLFDNTTAKEFARSTVISQTSQLLQPEVFTQLRGEIEQVFSVNMSKVEPAQYQVMMKNFLARPEIKERNYQRVAFGLLYDLTPQPRRNTQYCVIQPTAQGDAMVVVDERLKLDLAKRLGDQLAVGPKLAYGMTYCKMNFCSDLHSMRNNYTRIVQDGYFCLFPEVEECLYHMLTPGELVKDQGEARAERNVEGNPGIDWSDDKWNELLSPVDKKRLMEQDATYQEEHQTSRSLFNERELENLLRNIKRAMVLRAPISEQWEGRSSESQEDSNTAQEDSDADTVDSRRDRRAFVHHTTEPPEGLSLDELNRNVIVYDCAQPQNIEPVTVDLKEPSCKPPGPVDKKTKVDIVLLQKTRRERITVHRCRVLRSTLPLGCGMHSHQWLYLPFVQIEVPETVSEDVCRQMHRTQQYLDVHGRKHNLDLNALNVINIPITGNIDQNGEGGHCSPGVGTFNGRNYNKMVIHNYYKVWIEKMPADWEEETGYITTIEDRVTLACHSKRGGCLRKDDIYFWSPPEDELRCPYYKARSSSGVIVYGTDATTYMSNDGTLIRLVLKGRRQKCGRECNHGTVWATNYEDLFISEDVDNEFFERKVAVDSLSLAMYANVQDSVLLSLIEERIEAEHASIVQEDCKQRAARVRIDYSAIMAEQMRPVEGTMAALGGGLFVEHAGDLFYKFSCRPYVAQVRYADACFGNLPVSLSKKDQATYWAARGHSVQDEGDSGLDLELYMQPRSHLLTQVGIAQECRPDMAPIFQGAYGDFIQYTPGSSVKIMDPKKLELTPREVRKASRLWVQTDLEAGGIYDHETVRKMDDRSSLGSLYVDVGRQWAMEAMKRQYQSRQSVDQDFSGGFLRSSFMAITSFFSFVIWWGDIVSGVLGVITLVQIGSWIFALILRCSSPPFHPAAGLTTRVVTALFPSAVRFLSQFEVFGGETASGRESLSGRVSPQGSPKAPRKSSAKKDKGKNALFNFLWTSKFHKVPQDADLAEAEEMKTIIRRKHDTRPEPTAPDFLRGPGLPPHQTFFEDAAATDSELRALADRPPPPPVVKRVHPSASPGTPARRPGSPQVVFVPGDGRGVYQPGGRRFPIIPPLTIRTPPVEEDQWARQPNHASLLMELDKMRLELEGGNEALARVPATRRNAIISQLEAHSQRLRSHSPDLDLSQLVHEIRRLKQTQAELEGLSSRSQIDPLEAGTSFPPPPPPSSTPL